MSDCPDTSICATNDATGSANRRRCSARVGSPLAFILGVCLLCAQFGCSSIDNDVNDRLLPSNFRDWSPEFAVLPFVELEDNHVRISNIRNNSYLSNNDYVVDHYDREFPLDEIQTVDFFVVPFAGYEFMAHTMLSFGLSDGTFITVSAEIRTERGEEYSPIAGLARQYEITYVVADERDLVRLRTGHRDADVYLYRTVATPEQSQALFLDVMNRVNELASRPEFYDTVTNNCTTNIVRHVNRLRPNRVPYSVEVLLPGFSDRYAYDLGLLDTSLPFKSLKQQAWINDLANEHYDDEEFSQLIRARLHESSRRARDEAGEGDPSATSVQGTADPPRRSVAALLSRMLGQRY